MSLRLLPKELIFIVYDYYYDIKPLKQKVLDQISKIIYLTVHIDGIMMDEVPFQFSTYENALKYIKTRNIRNIYVIEKIQVNLLKNHKYLLEVNNEWISCPKTKLCTVYRGYTFIDDILDSREIRIDRRIHYI